MSDKITQKETQDTRQVDVGDLTIPASMMGESPNLALAKAQEAEHQKWVSRFCEYWTRVKQ